MKKSIILAHLCLMFLLVGCSNEPRPINYGTDECDYCKMKVMDNKYGAELVTEKGKIYIYDSIECMVNYISSEKLSDKDYASIWVENYANPGILIDASEGIYLKNDNIRSPMGLNVLAVETNTEFQKIYSENGGEKLTFNDLFRLIDEE